MEKSRHQHRIVCECRLPAYAHAVSRRAACSGSDFKTNLSVDIVSNMNLCVGSKINIR